MNANSSNKISNWLSQATKELDAAGIGTAKLDALVLLEDALHKDRTHLLAHSELELTTEQKNTLDAQILRRAKNHEPLAYILGKTEFYGREFIITPDVLEPRPETETMVDVVKTLTLKNGAVIIDVGTGSGAIAITTKLELPKASVIATDIDPACLKVTKSNVVKHSTGILLKKGDLIEPIKSQIDVIVANLPYVPNDFVINKAAQNEPRVAIFGGTDGLDLYRKLFAQIDHLKAKPSHVLAESLPPQHKKLSSIAQKSGYKLHGTDDFIQHFVFADASS